VYVDEPYLSIRWDSVHQHVHTEWRAFANSTELRAGLLKGIRAIKDNKAVAYVSDARKVKVIVHADQQWIKESWLPLAIGAGLKRLAFVTAPTGLGKLSMAEESRIQAATTWRYRLRLSSSSSASATPSSESLAHQLVKAL